MTEKIIENIYRIFVPLPKNPLKNLNAYLIKGEKNLLIDTGFNMPECRRALMEGLSELDAEPGKTDIFLTHLHSDHSKGSLSLSRLPIQRYLCLKRT
jgi:glyoxylase-like metal-dependent hydrolase (beta-lactamase superfamily II)